MVRPERFELPAFWFVARRSIQLSYGRPVYEKQLRYGCQSQFLREACASPDRRDAASLVRQHYCIGRLSFPLRESTDPGNYAADFGPEWDWVAAKSAFLIKFANFASRDCPTVVTSGLLNWPNSDDG